MSKLVVEGVSKKFGKNIVLEDVSLELEMGHCYGLLGRNGAGKSTLINIIMQRVKRDKGQLLLDGEGLDNNDRLMSKLFCMSDRATYPEEFKLKTIFNITHSMYENFDMEYAKRLAEEFGLDLNKRAGKLSTGYTTVYKVILALASNADFIFLDEPVLGMDVNLRELFYRELAKKMAESESCFVISTHLIEEAQNLIDTVLVIHDKRLLINREIDELLTDYAAISGKADIVDEFVKDKQVVGSETMSVFKTVVVKVGNEETLKLPEGLTEETINLQKLFYYLTGGVPDEA